MNRAAALSVLADPARSPALALLVHHLARRFTLDFDLDGPTSSSTAPVLADVATSVPTGRRVARWVDGADLAGLDTDSLAGASAVVVPATVAAEPGVVEAARRTKTVVVAVPQPAIDASRWRPVSPFVRRRWRRRLGLPEDFVAHVGIAGAPVLDTRTAADALFTCAAAVVGPGHLLPALALGTPFVCGSEAAAANGVEDGVHGLVLDGAAAATAAAADLARDDVRAATLGRDARRLAVDRHDVDSVAGRLGELLGLESVTQTGVPAVDRVKDALVELGTAPGSPVAARARTALATLGPSTRATIAGGFRW